MKFSLVGVSRVLFLVVCLRTFGGTPDRDEVEEAQVDEDAGVPVIRGADVGRAINGARRGSMRIRLVASLCAMTVVSIFVSLTAVSFAGQVESWKVPRTVDGQPDLQGVWANNNVTPLERPDVLAGRETLTDEELAALRVRASELFSTESGDAAFGDSVFAAVLAEVEDFSSRDTATGNYNHFWMVERDWNNRTSLVIDPPDGRLPSRTAAAAARLAERAEARRRHAWGPEDRSLGERCISWGVPRLGAGYNSYSQIFQSQDYVVIYMEMGGARVVPLDGRPHIDESVRQQHGNSRGHWDGDTLVVETTNYAGASYFMGSRDNLHLVERFTRVSEDVLRYEVTVTDLTTWTAPWTAMIPLRRSPDAIFEYACHEGNIGMEGIMAGARVLEKAEAESVKAGGLK